MGHAGFRNETNQAMARSTSLVRILRAQVSGIRLSANNPLIRLGALINERRRPSVLI